MDLVRPEFVDRVRFYGDVWWPARSLVAAALERRFEVHPCGRIIEFESGGCPYKEHLYELEEEQVIKKPLMTALGSIRFIGATQNHTSNKHLIT